jgi:hypothetical protein
MVRQSESCYHSGGAHEFADNNELQKIKVRGTIQNDLISLPEIGESPLYSRSIAVPLEDVFFVDDKGTALMLPASPKEDLVSSQIKQLILFCAIVVICRS